MEMPKLRKFGKPPGASYSFAQCPWRRCCRKSNHALRRLPPSISSDPLTFLLLGTAKPLGAVDKNGKTIFVARPLTRVLVLEIHDEDSEPPLHRVNVNHESKQGSVSPHPIFSWEQVVGGHGFEPRTFPV